MQISKDSENCKGHSKQSEADPEIDFDEFWMPGCRWQLGFGLFGFKLKEVKLSCKA